MTRFARLLIRTVLVVLASPALAEPSVATAAANLVPEATWRAETALTADLTCQHRPQHTILGSTRSEILVAIFTEGLNAKPSVLRFPMMKRNPTSLRIKAEALDFGPDDFADSLGEVPEGFRSSKTCKGIELGDGRSDAMHIYWNHERRRFNAWLQQ